MSKDFKHMDNAFQKMSEGFKVTYDSAYWDEMQSQLDDHFMDDAFKTAAASSFVVPELPDMGDIGASLDDAFMDDAFKNAATQQQAAYSAAYFADFKAQEADLQMNDAFNEAANSSVADYNPHYWSDADKALQNEGLHYEYKSHYWTEARSLLDLADRRQFFMRWSAAATILLLISFVGLNGIDFDLPMAESVQNGVVLDYTGADDTKSSEMISDANYSELISAFEAELDLESNVGLVAPEFAEEGGLVPTVSPSNPNDLTALNATNVSGNNSGNKGGTEKEDASTTGTQDIAMNPIIIPDLEIEEESPKMITLNKDADVKKIRTYGGGLTRPHNRFLSEERQITLMSESADKVYTPEMNTEESIADFDLAGSIRKMPFTQTKLIEPKIVAFAPEKIEFKPYVHKPSHTFALYAGVGMGREYGPSYLEASRRFNAGFEYMHMTYGKLNRFEFGLSAGVNHVRQTNLTYGEYLEGTTIYADEYRSWFKVAYTDLFHFNANLRVNYRIAPRHKFTFGFGYEMPVAVQTNVVGENVNGREGIYTSNNNWGITEGIEDDFRFSFGYQYELTKRISANITGNLGVKDRTNNDHFGNDFLDQEYNLMIGLKYNLIRR